MPEVIASLWRDRRGIAFMEFALALPLLMILILSGIEVANLALTHQQVSRMASVAADNAARYRSSISEADVRKLLLGSRLASSGLDVQAHGRLIISSVTENAKKTGFRIRWQRCDGGLKDDGVLVQSAFGPEEARTSPQAHRDVGGMVIAPGSNVMFAEAYYDYRPIFVGRWAGPIRIRYQATAMARQLKTYDIIATPGETPMSC